MPDKCQVTIDIDVNGHVTISGPINDPTLMLDIFARAMTAVVLYQYGTPEQKKPKIIVPSLQDVTLAKH